MKAVGAVGLALLLVLAAEAQVDAYLDPGSGSMLVQLLLGGVAGAAVIVKLGWQRVLGISVRRERRGEPARGARRRSLMSDIALEPGSFRDRTARVFYHNGKIYRGLTGTALKEWEALAVGEVLSAIHRQRRHRCHQPDRPDLPSPLFIPSVGRRPRA